MLRGTGGGEGGGGGEGAGGGGGGLRADVARAVGNWDQGALDGFGIGQSLICVVLLSRRLCSRLLLTRVSIYSFITLWFCNP